jgi:phosphatidylglycerophosphatase A
MTAIKPKTPLPADGWRRPDVWIASVFGLGRLPASGTVGSAAGLAGYLLLPPDAAVQAAVILAVCGLGVWASRPSPGSAGHDPSYVVIDEAAGMLIAAFLLPREPLWLGLAFLGFRLLDIGKWFPMKQLERLPGGWGIMADDVAAGLLTRLALLPWVGLRG